MNQTAFMMSLIAGLCTGIGGIIGIILRDKGKKMISIALGFSAGIMIAVSLSDILPHAMETLIDEVGLGRGASYGMLALLSGILLGKLIDVCMPEVQASASGGMYRLGLFAMISLMAHNLPEGMVVYISTSANCSIGTSLAFAIGLHNIPEGIAVALPIYAATGNAKKGIFYAVLSGLAEPLGAFLAYAILGPVIVPLMLEFIMAMVAGLMLYVAFCELIPSAIDTNGAGSMSFGALMGIFVMLTSVFIVS